MLRVSHRARLLELQLAWLTPGPRKALSPTPAVSPSRAWKLPQTLLTTKSTRNQTLSLMRHWIFHK